MIHQYISSDIDWVMGLGIMFGISFLITLLIKDGDMYTFFGFAYIMNGLVVIGGLLEEWTLILNTIFIIILIYLKITGGKGGKET